jgi:nitroreductase
MVQDIATISPLITARRSGLAYDPDVELTDLQITSLCEAAHWAPSCYGDEPWQFVVWNKHQNNDAWQQALDCLVPGNQTWAQNAPLFFLTASSPKFKHNDKPNRWQSYDTGAAALNLCLQATHLGLVNHQMGGFDADKLKQIFHIPDEIECWAMIAIGAPADINTLSADLQERALQARSRRPLMSNFHHHGWQGQTK